MTLDLFKSTISLLHSDSKWPCYRNAWIGCSIKKPFHLTLEPLPHPHLLLLGPLVFIVEKIVCNRQPSFLTDASSRVTVAYTYTHPNSSTTFTLVTSLVSSLDINTRSISEESNIRIFYTIICSVSISPYEWIWLIQY